MWIVGGRKGDLTLTYSRVNPVHGDERFASLGKRFLDLAGIDIPKEGFY